MNSVDLGPDSFSHRREGFKPCLSFKFEVREYALKLSNSVSNLLINSGMWFVSVSF